MADNQGQIHILQAVDVGVDYYAIATFGNGALQHCALIKNTIAIAPPYSNKPEHNARLRWDLVIECATQRKKDGHTKVREVNALNRTAGRLGALHPSPTFLLPEAWKGQLSKPIDQARTMKTLTDEERACLPETKGELKHVLDAIGIGLKALGRR